MEKINLVSHTYWAQRNGRVNGKRVSITVKAIYGLFYLHLYRGAEQSCITSSFFSHRVDGKWKREDMKPLGRLFDHRLFDLFYDVVTLDAVLQPVTRIKFLSDGETRAVEFNIETPQPLKIPPLACEAAKHKDGYMIGLSNAEEAVVSAPDPDSMFRYLSRRRCLCGAQYRPHRLSSFYPEAGKRMTAVSCRCMYCGVGRTFRFDTASVGYRQAVAEGIRKMAREFFIPPEPPRETRRFFRRRLIEMHEEAMKNVSAARLVERAAEERRKRM